MKKFALLLLVLFGCSDERLEEKYHKAYVWMCTYADTPETHMFRSREVGMMFEKVGLDDRQQIMKIFEDHGCRDWKHTEILVY